MLCSLVGNNFMDKHSDSTLGLEIETVRACRTVVTVYRLHRGMTRVSKYESHLIKDLNQKLKSGYYMEYACTILNPFQ
jgi:hypothetical protein